MILILNADIPQNNGNLSYKLTLSLHSVIDFVASSYSVFMLVTAVYVELLPNLQTLGIVCLTRQNTHIIVTIMLH